MEEKHENTRDCAFQCCLLNVYTLASLVIALALWGTYFRQYNDNRGYLQTDCEIIKYNSLNDSFCVRNCNVCLDKNKTCIIGNITIDLNISDPKSNKVNVIKSEDTMIDFTEKYPLHKELNCYYLKKFPELVFWEPDKIAFLYASYVFFTIAGIIFASSCFVTMTYWSLLLWEEFKQVEKIPV